MLEHLNSSPQKPARVVVIGAAGFVGNAVAARIEKDGVSVLRVGRKEVDLLAPDAADKLLKIIKEGDAVVAAAARAPVKDSAMLVENMIMACAMVRALASAAHVVNISSDAVYADSDRPLSESSCAEPGSLHGAMHLAREVMFRNEVKAIRTTATGPTGSVAWLLPENPLSCSGKGRNAATTSTSATWRNWSPACCIGGAGAS
jgi:nucleoside-diphosphate-sugar epimerase